MSTSHFFCHGFILDNQKRYWHFVLIINDLIKKKNKKTERDTLFSRNKSSCFKNSSNEISRLPSRHSDKKSKTSKFFIFIDFILI